MNLRIVGVGEMRRAAESLLAAETSSAPTPPSPPSQARTADGLLTVRDVAGLLTVSSKKIYRMVQLGTIPHVRLGRSVRFREQDILAWVARKSLLPRGR